MHLHGHDFFILGRGTGQFDPVNNFTLLNFNNPPRRDVTYLPAGGWTVLVSDLLINLWILSNKVIGFRG
jgi:Multicopper oxidase